MTKLKMRRRLLVTSLAMTGLLALCQTKIQALFPVMPLLIVMKRTLEKIWKKLKRISWKSMITRKRKLFLRKLLQLNPKIYFLLMRNQLSMM